MPDRRPSPAGPTRRRPSRKIGPPGVEFLEERALSSFLYPHLVVVERGAALATLVEGANTSTKEDFLRVVAPRIDQKLVRLSDSGSPSWSITENLAYGSPSSADLVDLNVFFSASASKSQIPLDMHGSAGTVRTPGQDHGQFITLKIAPGHIPPKLQKKFYRYVNKNEVMVSIQARHSVDGDGVLSSSQGTAVASYKYKGKNNPLLEDSGPFTLGASGEAGRRFVAKIGDTVQIRLMSQDNVTIDGSQPGGSAFGDNLSLSVQLMPIVKVPR
jgi:hypothetical protein